EGFLVLREHQQAVVARLEEHAVAEPPRLRHIPDPLTGKAHLKAMAVVLDELLERKLRSHDPCANLALRHLHSPQSSTGSGGTVFSTLNRRFAPFGNGHSMACPSSRPRSAVPTGARIEILPLDGSASS